MTDGRRPPHPANTLNELSGEEWLYFTKSLLTTAYPSELGHAARKAHGANKPPRLMARLIEFFSRTGELVLDPFAGVGGTLLGAAIARGPRRAIGIELDPRWADGLRQVVVGTLAPSGTARGPSWPTWARPIPAGRAAFDPSGCELRVGDALAVLPDARRRLGRLRRDRSALQPAAADDDGRRARWPRPTPTGGPTTRWSPTRPRPRQRGRLPGVPRPDGTRLRGAASRPARRPLRRRDRPRRLPGWALPVHRLGSGGAGGGGRASCPRAISSGTRPGRGCGRTAIRGPSCRTSSTSTSWCCARKRPGVSDRGGATRGRPRGRRCRRPPRPSSRSSRSRSASWRPGCRPGTAVDDVAEGHLVEPALATVRAEDQPVGAVLLEQLDFVAPVEVADLRCRAARRACRAAGRRDSG